jgi:Effector Associated Constant Component 1
MVGSGHAPVGDDRVLIEIDSGVSGFAQGSDRWHREREDLRGELQRALGPSALLAQSPKPGAKGAELVPIVVALAGGTAIPSLARCLEMWLKTRPRDWSFRITRVDDDKGKSVYVTAENLPSDAVESLARLLGKEDK